MYKNYRVPVVVKKIHVQIVLCYLKFSLYRPDIFVMFSVACGIVWFIYCHLWKTESCVHVFPFPFVCTGVCMHTHLCVRNTDVSLHKLLWLYQVNFFSREHQLASLSAFGLSYNPLQESRPNYLSLSLPALMPRDVHSLYCNFPVGVDRIRLVRS